MKIGYKRVSTTDQHLDRQDFAGLQLDQVFEDKASGKAGSQREGLKTLINYARAGDTVYVHSLDRLGRSTKELLALVEAFTLKGITVHFLKENIITGQNSAAGNMMITIFSAFSQFERELMLERQREGIVKAKERGAYSRNGAQTKITPSLKREIKAMLESGANISDIAINVGLSRATLYRNGLTKAA